MHILKKTSAVKPLGNASPAHHFGYVTMRPMLGTCSAAFLSLITSGLSVLATVARRNDPDYLAGMLFLIGCATFFALLSVAFLFNYSDWIIDDLGLHRSIFDKCWRTTLWTNVRRIRIKPVAPAATAYWPRLTTVYFIDEKSNPHPVYSFFLRQSFTDLIDELPKMLDLINGYIDKHNVEILNCGNDPPSRLDRLSAPDSLQKLCTSQKR